MKTVFLNLQGAPAKAAALALYVDQVNCDVSNQTVTRVNPAEFLSLPGTPLAYFQGEAVLELFRTLPATGTAGREAWVGLQTNDNFLWLRLLWESVDSSGEAGLVPFSKGGEYSRFYADVHLGLRWGTSGRAHKAWKLERVRLGDLTPNNSKCWNESRYFRPGLTWSLRSQRGLALRALAAGCVFSNMGPTAFCEGDDNETLLSMAAICNSSCFARLVSTHVSTAAYEVGTFENTPFPAVPAALVAVLASLAGRAWSRKRSLDTVTETSHAFHLPALLVGATNRATTIVAVSLEDRATAYAAQRSMVESELATIQAEIDDIAFRLYGIGGEDRARIEAEAGPSPGRSGHPLAQTGDRAGSEAPYDAENTGSTEDEPDDEDDSSTADTATLAIELLSWAIGVAFGRFDIRHATGELPAPIEPGPFDPLPARSPGMCPDDSLAVAFLVDDPGHPLDLGKRIADVFAAVFPADHEARLDEAVRLAGSTDIQAFLRRTFFPFHLKRYSKSRRKAPIWWPLSTASGSYTVWLGWPQLTRDTLFRVADEIKRQKLPFETRRLVSLKQEHGPNPTSRDKATIAAQEDLVSELSALLEEIERVAPLWNPVHDDGVILHYALLWRVVRDAAWQKECRSAWDKLAKGDYDWAHVAMHLWPERVAPKCRTDRSLAIAHGLEDTFWVEVAGKWRARDDTDAVLAAASAARTSPAIKSALRAFVEAPTPGRSGRGKKGT